MRLYEHEAKELLAKHAIRVPKSILHRDRYPAPWVPCVVKAQVLFGNRAKQGGVVLCATQAEAQVAINKLFDSTLQGEHITHLLVEEFVKSDAQYYVSFFYDNGAPVLMLSAHGGSGIEERAHSSKTIPVSPFNGINRQFAIAALTEAHMPVTFADFLVSLWTTFTEEDCKLLEINPLVMMDRGPMALDCRIELDDAAASRHTERHYASRPNPLGRPYTDREATIKAANDADHHGTVKYIELDGDIAVLAAGGGGSLTAIDSLIEAGGKPANYTEFSGDPTEVKMYVLTKNALSKPGVHGCWIVGAVANFSRVDTMMAGVVRALVEIKPDFPIVVRRAGPFEKEGLAILANAAKEHGWDIEVHGAETLLTATVPTMVAKAKAYASRTPNAEQTE